MRLCVPTLGDKGLDDEVSGHFGRAPSFTIVDTDSGEVEVVENTSEHMGGEKKPPTLLDEKNIDVLLCSNLGRRAVARFEELGVEVYSGASRKVSDVVDDWENGDLDIASKRDACEGNH